MDQLSKYFGKEYISKCGTWHCKVFGRSLHPTHEHDPFAEYTLTSWNVYSYIPFDKCTGPNGGVSPELLDREYIEITPAAKVLYYPKPNTNK